MTDFVEINGIKIRFGKNGLRKVEGTYEGVQVMDALRIREGACVILLGWTAFTGKALRKNLVCITNDGSELWRLGPGPHDAFVQIRKDSDFIGANTGFGDYLRIDNDGNILSRVFVK